MWSPLRWLLLLCRMGSVVVVHRPSCPTACGILLDQRSNPCRLHWQADSLPPDHKGSPALCSSATTSRICHQASQVLPYFRVFPLGVPLSGTPHPPLHTHFIPLSPSLKTGFCPSLGLKDVTSSKRPSLTIPSPPPLTLLLTFILIMVLINV